MVEIKKKFRFISVGIFPDIKPHPLVYYTVPISQ